MLELCQGINLPARTAHARYVGWLMLCVALAGCSDATPTTTNETPSVRLGDVLWLDTLQQSGDAISLDRSHSVLYANDAQSSGASDPRRVVAINAENGAILWQTDPGGPLNWKAPAIGTDGTTYWGALAGANGATFGGLVAVGPDGTVKWHFAIADAAPSSLGAKRNVWSGPAIDGTGNLYFASEEDGSVVYSLTASGQLRWRMQLRPSGNDLLDGDIALSGDTLALVYERDSLAAVSTADGSVRWWAPTGNVNGSCTLGVGIGADGSIYVPGLILGSGSLATGIRHLSASGNVLSSWTLDRGWNDGSPLLSGQTVTALGAGGGLTSGTSGESASTFGALGPVVSGGALGANGVRYVMGDSLISFDASGARRFAVSLGTNALPCYARNGPLIGADGTVYARNGSRVFAVHDTIGPAEATAWAETRGSPERTGRIGN